MLFKMSSRYLFFSLCVFFCSSVVFAQKTFTEKFSKMGSSFEVIVVAKNKEVADGFILMAKNEISRIENLISSWDSNSETSKINQNAGVKPVKVSKELWDLIERSQKLSQLTSGAFDISYAAVDKIWTFDGGDSELPAESVLKRSVAKIGYKKIRLNQKDQTVFLSQAGMKIGFGAIGKGYAADRAKEILVAAGASGGIINASGDMNTWGTHADGSDWNVAIVNPLNSKKVFSWFSIEQQAVVTSGDYERFTTIAGERYSHIIDPRTGMPAKGILSCTIFAPKAELADALATATFVMGTTAGIFLINQLPKVEAIIIDALGRTHTSKNIKIEDD